VKTVRTEETVGGDMAAASGRAALLICRVKSKNDWRC